MPSKGKRTASRQAQLSQRRRRRGGRRARQEAQESDAQTQTMQRPAATAQRAANAVRRQPQAPAAATTADAPGPQRSVAASPRARIRSRTARVGATERAPLPMYAYLGSELKRIGVLAVIMGAALTGLTFILN